MHCWFRLPGRPEDSTPLPVMPPPLLLGALMFWALEPFTLDPFGLVALPSLFSPLSEPLLVLSVPLIAVTPDPPWDACSPFAAAFAPFGSVTCAAF